MSEDFGAAHERYLASYSTHSVQVWCANKECPNHTGPTTVRFEVEYGQGWYTPEECDLCGGGWLEEQPEEDDDE